MQAHLMDYYSRLRVTHKHNRIFLHTLEYKTQQNIIHTQKFSITIQYYIFTQFSNIRYGLLH